MTKWNSKAVKELRALTTDDTLCGLRAKLLPSVKKAIALKRKQRDLLVRIGVEAYQFVAPPRTDGYAEGDIKWHISESMAADMACLIAGADIDV